jgi:hypothetical protein
MESKLPHNYFTIAGKAFIEYLDRMFLPFKQSIGGTFPIMIKNTGDEAFVSNMNGKELYASTPRLSMEVRGITLQNDQLTNHHLHGKASLPNELGFNESKIIPVRRVPINWMFNTEVYFNTILEYLEFVDILLTVSHHNHHFTFYYLGNEYSGTFFLPEDFDSESNSQLGFDSEKRRRILPLMFMLQLQFPSYDFYKISQHMDPEILDESTKMQKIIHNVKINDDSESGITYTNEITKDDDSNNS